jgi:hypothetical protein
MSVPKSQTTEHGANEFVLVIAEKNHHRVEDTGFAQAELLSQCNAFSGAILSQIEEGSMPRVFMFVLILLVGCKPRDDWFVQSLTGEQAVNVIKRHGNMYTVQCKHSFVTPLDGAPMEYPPCGSLIREYVGRSISSVSFPPLKPEATHHKPDADGWVTEMSIDEHGSILRLERYVPGEPLSRHKWYQETYSIISVVSQQH